MTVGDADNVLRRLYDDFAAKSTFPVEEIQERFIAHLLFPRPAWDLVVAGAIEAEARGDAASLQEGASKFLACYWRVTDRFDANGLGIGSGCDWSSYEGCAVYAALLGRWDLVARMFPPERALAKHGSPAVKCTANLWVLLAHPDWKHAEGARARARALLEAKSRPLVDKAYVGYFLAIERSEVSAALTALQQFLSLYPKSDWGRHLPELRPVLAMGLLAVADCYRPALLPPAALPALLGDAWHALWEQHARWLAAGTSAIAFEGSLAFLRAG
jgi:hypothetical protein